MIKYENGWYDLVRGVATAICKDKVSCIEDGAGAGRPDFLDDDGGEAAVLPPFKTNGQE